MDRIERITRQVAMIVLVALAAPSAGRAEGFVDLRVGGAFTDDGDVEVRGPGTFAEFETEYDDSVTGGVRGGYWFDFLPWLGIAGDVSYFAPEDDIVGTEIDVIPLSPLLMGRVPIATSEEYPHGRVQPFAGIGPGIFVSLHDFDSIGAGDDESVDVGLDAHAGLNVQLTPVVSLFTQYRYTYFEPEVDIGNAEIESEIGTHHVAFGAGFHF